MTGKAPALAGCIGLIAGHACATNFHFDELADGIFTNQYASLGVNSDGASSIWGGLGNGDPGNWQLFGTNGSKFLGNNGDNQYTTTIFFDADVTGVSFDLSRSLGSTVDDTWVARIFDAGSNEIAFTGGSFLGINEWTHVVFNQSGIRKLTVQSSGPGFHPYGTDDFTFNAVPEPASLLALSAGALALLRRRPRR